MKSEAFFKKQEIIQAIISRMANNSFYVKGWSITLTLGVLAYYSETNNRSIILILIVALFLFWYLDSYYLRAEKAFRALYEEEVANIEKNKNITLSLAGVKKYIKFKGLLSCGFFSFPTVCIYVSEILICAMLYLN